MKQICGGIAVMLGLILVIGSCGGLEQEYIDFGKAALLGGAGLVVMWLGAELGGLFYER